MAASPVLGCACENRSGATWPASTSTVSEGRSAKGPRQSEIDLCLPAACYTQSLKECLVVLELNEEGS